MKNIVIANWKMNGLPDDWTSWTTAATNTANLTENTEIVLCVPAPAFSLVGKRLEQSSKTKLGAQIISDNEKGAYTGEISVDMLKAFGGEYTLVGHSECRARTTEIYGLYSSKMKTALRHGVKPILCIGETAKERAAEETFKILDAQLEDCLKDVHFSRAEDIIIAYEPVWGIGGASALKTPEVADVKSVYRFIRSTLVERYGDMGYDIPLLYGGSVDAGNVCSFMQELDIKGVLVGSASLKSDVFQAIVQQVDNV